MKRTKMTMAQALVKFLDNQYVSMDGVETKFVEGIFTVFGHGIVLGLGQALDENPGQLRVHQGRNEQGMAHVAAGFAKQNNRKKIIACASSIGPGAANMVTAAATATVNNIPLLLLPGDVFATRQPDPVLQQIEQPASLSITTNDAFKAVCKYWDRVTRAEQLMSAMINAMRVLTDPAETGAVCIALPQDVQGESFEYPDYFFEKRVHKITRPVPVSEELDEVVEAVLKSKHPMVICGGGVRYSEAGRALEEFCEAFHIPFGETQAGKSACRSSSPYCLGGMGVTGNLSANSIAEQADLVLAVGTRLSDFTTASKSLFQNPDAKFVSINISRFHAYKADSVMAVGDAKAALTALTAALKEKGYRSAYQNEISELIAAWNKQMEAFAEYAYDDDFKPIVKAGEPGSIKEFVELTGGVVTQTSAICLIREMIPEDAIVVGASGSLPGDLQRMWTTDARDSYHMEYGYSCMGYEVNAALGVKLARPDREVYSMVGDGSYMMLHSELPTSIQEGAKINVILFDNMSFGCINNLQMGNGMGSFGTEFRFRNPVTGKLDGKLVPVDFARNAESYGCKTYAIHTEKELTEALEDSRKQTVSTLLDIKVLPKTMTHDYESWWRVGNAEVAEKERITRANEEMRQELKKARQY